jgi:hypothetical protein
MYLGARSTLLVHKIVVRIRPKLYEKGRGCYAPAPASLGIALWTERCSIRRGCGAVTCSVSVLDVDCLGARSCGQRPRLAGRVGHPARPSDRPTVPEAHVSYARGRGEVAGRQPECHVAADGGVCTTVDGYRAPGNDRIHEPAAGGRGNVDVPGRVYGPNAEGVGACLGLE